MMEVRSSWWTFAGVMVLIGGLLNAFDGLVAIAHSRYIKVRIGDVWYDSATPRAEAAVDQWQREHRRHAKDGGSGS